MPNDQKEWWISFVDRICRDVTVETSGAYDGEMIRDNLEETIPAILAAHRERMLDEVEGRIEKLSKNGITRKHAWVFIRDLKSILTSLRGEK